MKLCAYSRCNKELVRKQRVYGLETERAFAKRRYCSNACSSRRARPLTAPQTTPPPHYMDDIQKLYDERAGRKPVTGWRLIREIHAEVAYIRAHQGKPAIERRGW
jgi:hypothetical protein